MMETLAQRVENLEQRAALIEQRLNRKRQMPLSQKEVEVLEFLAQGKTGKEIAIELSISPQTVKNHCYLIYRKLGVRNRVEAALKFKMGVV